MAYKAKIQKLINEVDNQLLERRSLIRMSILCIFARHHIMLFGVPGVGKTYAISKIMEMVKGQEAFEIVMSDGTTLKNLIPNMDNPDMTEEEILADKKGLIAHRFIFLDEMFKGPESVLNALLGILNERKFEIKGKSCKIPLSSMFCASNEIPSGEFIKPFKDRILFWFDVKPLKEQENKLRYLQEQFFSTKLSESFEYEDILEAEKIVKSRPPLSEEMARCFMQLIAALRRGSIEISDRKCGPNFITKAFKTSALINDREEVNYSDLYFLKHMSWTNLRQKRQASIIVNNIIFGNRSEIDTELFAMYKEKNSAFVEYEDGLNEIYDLTVELMIFEYEANMEKVRAFKVILEELKEKLEKMDKDRIEYLRRWQECLDNILIAEEAYLIPCPFRDNELLDSIQDLENEVSYALLKCERVLEDMPNFIFYQNKFLEKQGEN